ncbi:MAG: amino acid permease [Bacillota bacterium]|nr:amino acid permease [Bacillota bacterium]
MKKASNGLSARQLTMMGLGSVIGGSFFLGSSVPIHAAGPAVIITFVLCGVMVHYILYALSEMTIKNPDSGSFRTFAAQAFGQGAGFLVGWVYWTGMVFAMSSEATAVSILVRKWFPTLSISFLGSIIIICVTLINLLGADKLSKFESALATVKVVAIIFFILIAMSLIVGLYPGKPAVGIGALANEPLMPGGIMGIAGSILVVMFAYAGFEVIGLAASEADTPQKTIPKAIRYTVVSLLGLYILSSAVMLPLIPTNSLSENKSAMVAALEALGIGWAGASINIILMTAILSTMFAALFGLGRMMRSLANEGFAPGFLIDKKDVPYHGILFSGLSILLGLWLALLAPRVYLFLISSGGFAVLFTYAAIMATHIRLSIKDGRPAKGEFRMRGFPYSSLIVLVFLIVAIISMPFVSGQASGLVTGASMVAFYTLCYLIMKLYKRNYLKNRALKAYLFNSKLSTEISDELTDNAKKEDDDLSS